MLFGNIKSCWITFVLVVLAVSSCFVKAQPSLLTFVSAIDHIPGSFLGDQAVYADHDRIYLGSGQGQLFVRARDRVNNFPSVETITFGVPVVSVLGDNQNLLVLTLDGRLWTFCKSHPLQFVKVTQLPGYGAESITLLEGQTYVSTGQSEMEVDHDKVYFSPVNEGDVGLLLPRKSAFNAARPPVFGRGSSFGYTTVYNRQTGSEIGRILNPYQDFAQVALFGDQTRLFQTIPGPYGVGIWIYNKCDLSYNRFVELWGANTAASAHVPGRDLLIGGTEGGIVKMFDLDSPVSTLPPCVGTVDLPVITGFTSAEDIEIRALWCDGLDNLVFCGSSWGNTTTQSLNLPSFFVLEIEMR